MSSEIAGREKKKMSLVNNAQTSSGQSGSAAAEPDAAGDTAGTFRSDPVWRFSKVGNPKKTFDWDWDNDSDPRISRSFAFDHSRSEWFSELRHDEILVRTTRHPAARICEILDTNGLEGIDLGPRAQRRVNTLSSRFASDVGSMYDHIDNGRLASWEYLQGTASEEPWMRDWDQVSFGNSNLYVPGCTPIGLIT